MLLRRTRQLRAKGGRANPQCGPTRNYTAMRRIIRLQGDDCGKFALLHRGFASFADAGRRRILRQMPHCTATEALLHRSDDD